MDNITPKLKIDYRSVINNNNISELSDSETISEHDVLKAHYLIVDYFLEEDQNIYYGLKNYGLLSSAVNRQHIEFGGIKKWKTSYQRMATLFFGLTKNHAFHDGNKRTALLSLLFQLHKNNLQLSYKKEKLEELAIRIASNQLDIYGKYNNYKDKDDPEVEFIADYIKSITKKYNKRYYALTYAEFNFNLKKYNVYLDEPSGGYINVFKIKIKKGITTFFKEKQVRIKIMQIGFPGWKKQINSRATKEVLKKTGLTAENGIDSDVFYHNAEPLYLLINEFNEPLRRLKDK